MSEPSKAGDGSLERLREEATDDVAKEQVTVGEKAASKIAGLANDDAPTDEATPSQ